MPVILMGLGDLGLWIYGSRHVLPIVNKQIYNLGMTTNTPKHSKVLISDLALLATQPLFMLPVLICSLPSSLDWLKEVN
jgi:hypothetical protein